MLRVREDITLQRDEYGSNSSAGPEFAETAVLEDEPDNVPNNIGLKGTS
jgi:hypothetical protein